MAASIIIDGVIYGSPSYIAPDYNKNVGGLNIVTVDGVQFLMSNDDIRRLAIADEAVTDIDEVPADFLYDHHMEVDHGSFGNAPTAFPLKKEDVKAIGIALSKAYGSCRLTAMARVLAVWERGVCTQRRSLEEFYTNLTDTEKKRFNSL